MLRKLRIEIIIIFIALVAACVFGFLLATKELPSLENPISYTNSSSSADNLQSYAEKVLGLDFSKDTPEAINKKETSSSLKQAGWIPDWDFYNGYETLKQVTSDMDSVSPVWYYLDEDGSVIVNRSGLQELTQLRQDTGIKIIPSIASFSASEFKKAAGGPKRLQAHIDFLISEVETYDLDGIDLDYESIFLENQPEYLGLIKSLFEYLDERDKKLTIAVMPKWGEADIYPGLIQTRKVQNWATIAQFVHELRIMTYNLTGANSKYPGPIAPLDWMEANLRYAAPRVAPEKLVLGIHLYAYGGWGDQTTQQVPYRGFYNNPYEDEVQAAALTYEGIQDRKQAGGISDGMDSETGEKILRYLREGKEYIGYYMDAQTVRLRAQLAAKYGASGLAYWRMGDEDLGVYDRSKD